MKRIYIIVVSLIFLLLCCFYFFIFPALHWGNKATITSGQRNELKNAAVNSAQKKEVPVASLVVYDHQIIGRGSNLVISDTNIAAHAEINALNDAIKKIGWDSFKKLNRDSLFLITTFEPCPMCCGALSENNIEHVVVVQKKSLRYKIKEWKRGYTLQKQMKFVDGDNLQDSLFKIVPGASLKDIEY